MFSCRFILFYEAIFCVGLTGSQASLARKQSRLSAEVAKLKKKKKLHQTPKTTYNKIGKFCSIKFLLKVFL